MSKILEVMDNTIIVKLKEWTNEETIMSYFY